MATRWTNGDIYERSDELEEAYAFLSHALRSARLAVKPAYEIIATILNKLGKDEAALATYEQGLIIKRNLYPSFDKNIAVTFMNIARIDQQLGRYMIALSPRSPESGLHNCYVGLEMDRFIIITTKGCQLIR